MKQDEVNRDFRKPTELASYSHILSEVNLIQGVYIQNILKTSSIWTCLPFFILRVVVRSCTRWGLHSSQRWLCFSCR